MTWDRSPGRVAGLPKEAFRPSPLFLGVVALCAVSGWMTWTGFGNPRIDVFLFVCAAWVISLCLHEYAHAVVAYLGGDRGVADRGYLTLNPLKYTNPVLSIVLPLVFLMLGGIGLPGGAVWVDHGAVRSRLTDSLISFAGPATNLVLAIALILPFSLGAGSYGHPAFWAALAFLAFLQLTASILNFVPIPGVDGGNLIYPWLTPQGKRGFGHVAPYGMLLLIALLWSPVINSYFFNFVFWLGDLFGLPSGLVGEGLGLFKFWSF